MENNKRYWSGLDELNETQEFKEIRDNEFPAEQSVDEFLSSDKLKETNTGRRDFLKFMGFSLTAATLAACETPVVKSIPYVVKPEEVTPGVANYYATTYYDGVDYANILVKTREGRPIFIKGNSAHGLGGGSLNARVNSSVLGLYDEARLRQPLMNGTVSDWNTVDNAIAKGLSASGQTVLLSNTIASPSTSRAIEKFAEGRNFKHVQMDSISADAISSANKESFGSRFVPNYDFSKAKVIVSIGADFLGNWLNSNLYTAGYAKRRKPEGEWMSKHYQFEANMSLAGSNADTRSAIKPSQFGAVAAAIYNGISGSKAQVEGVNAAALDGAIADLKANKGASIVISSSNDVNVQLIVNEINSKLGNYGSTIDSANPSNLYRGNDAEMTQLVKDMNAGKVDTLIVYGANPAYSWNDAAGFLSGLAKVKNSISFSLYSDETASKCKFVCPDHHYLESWNDCSQSAGRVDIVQPTISPLHDTRQAQESLLRWAGVSGTYYSFMRSTYNGAYGEGSMFTDKGWNEAVHNGTMMWGGPAVPVNIEEISADEITEVAPAAPSVNINSAMSAATKVSGGTWELNAYVKTGIGDGSQAANPWLQELPDPVSKVTWDNYVTMSRKDMESLGLNTNTLGQREFASLVKVTTKRGDLVLPAFLQPGQKSGTVGIALGYGRGGNGEAIGRSAFQTGADGMHLADDNGNLVPVGKNVLPLLPIANGTVQFSDSDISLEKVDGDYVIACTQMQHTYMGRDSVVKETTYAAYKAEASKAKGQASWNKAHALVWHEDLNEDGKINSLDKKPVDEIDLWQAHPVENVGHRWGMTVDLSACIGCGACVTACHSENNVPVVGKDEVHRHRDMHWLRIDRFYSSDWSQERGEEEGVGTISSYTKMEDPAENPQTVHMPMMCQHCNHAPCETVCPVVATTHSNEGLNQMTYNRCIGTRYCANNCPYKVRRFNWFNYMGYMKFKNINPAQDSLARMVLNPDVAVRARGVMEKCSMCVQRIQGGKLEAKKAGLPVQDGAIQTACSEACEMGAITFGDLNDKKSNIASLAKNNRSYHALEEVGAQPNIYYMTKVRNNEQEIV